MSKITKPGNTQERCLEHRYTAGTPSCSTRFTKGSWCLGPSNASNLHKFEKKVSNWEQQTSSHRFELDLEVCWTQFWHSKTQIQSRNASNRGPRTDLQNLLRTCIIEHLRHSSRSARPASDFSCFRISACGAIIRRNKDRLPCNPLPTCFY